MKTYQHKLTALVLGAMMHSALGAESPATNSTSATSATNAIPRSVFEATLVIGRDPFFPSSSRRAVEVTAKAGDKAENDPTSLVLQGFSHSSTHPMATINNQSFQPGEESEVVTANGRMRIRCEEIKSDSVIISIGGSQRLELKMPHKY